MTTTVVTLRPLSLGDVTSVGITLTAEGGELEHGYGLGEIHCDSELWSQLEQVMDGGILTTAEGNQARFEIERVDEGQGDGRGDVGDGGAGSAEDGSGAAGRDRDPDGPGSDRG